MFAVVLEPMAKPPTLGRAAESAVVATRAPAATPVVPAPVAQPVSTPEPVKSADFRPDFTGPRVAILIADPGDDAAATRAAAAALPFEVGFAFPPGKGEALSGRERWLSMPMQPSRYPKVDPGPETLLTGAAAADNLTKLDKALGSGSAVGVTSLMGSAFTTDAKALAPVMAALKARGLPFIDARATPASIAAAEATKAGVPTAANKRFVDAGGDVAANLRALEATARREGRAVGFAKPLPGTTAAITAWAKGLEARGILLAPPGNLAK